MDQEQKIRENIEVMESLISELKQDDSQGIAGVNIQYQELQRVVADGKANVMRIVQDLSAQVTTLKEQSTPPEPPRAHEIRVQELDSERVQVQGKIDNLQEQLDMLRARREDMAKRFQDLRDQRARIDQMVMVEEPEMTNKFSLYCHISRLSVNLDHYPRKLSGVVMSEGDKGPQAFEIELTSMSQCQIADKLWDLME